MNVHFLSSPSGFSDAVSLMNKISSQSTENFTFVVNEVFKHERHGCGIPSILLKQSPPELKDIAKEELEGLVNALGHILRGCIENKAETPALVNALGTCTDASEATASTLVACWSDYSAKGAQEALNRVLNVGHLVGIDWKLGVALTSSSCNNLLAPFVTVVFHITDVNGNTVAEKVEFTYSEFQSVSKTMREVAAKLDRL